MTLPPPVGWLDHVITLAPEEVEPFATVDLRAVTGTLVNEVKPRLDQTSKLVCDVATVTFPSTTCPCMPILGGTMTMKSRDQGGA
jgi:hypothetical protein